MKVKYFVICNDCGAEIESEIKLERCDRCGCGDIINEKVGELTFDMPLNVIFENIKIEKLVEWLPVSSAQMLILRKETSKKDIIKEIKRIIKNEVNQNEI